MLIRFIVTNFLSFCEPTEFNMLTGSVRKKPEHVYEYKGIEFTRAAALYGANGAGKSNMIKAVAFLRDLVKGKDVHNLPFKLKANNDTQPSVFEIEFLQHDILYYYEVAVRGSIIVEEALYEVNQQQEDHLLFRRTTENNTTTLVVGQEYQQNPKEQYLIELYAEKLLKKEEPFLQRITKDEIAFDKIVAACEWLCSNLVVIFPSTTHNIGGMLDGAYGEEFSKPISKALKTLDTGIRDIGFERVSLEEYFGEDDKFKINFIRNILIDSEDNSFFYASERDITYRKEEDKIWVNKLVFKHLGQGFESDYIDFYLEEESDGSQRILDILSATQSALVSNATILIDEIDRSIHPSLTKAVVKSFMDAPETKGQLIFTTRQ